MVEYALIIAVIAVVVIAAMKIFGQQIIDFMKGITLDNSTIPTESDFDTTS